MSKCNHFVLLSMNSSMKAAAALAPMTLPVEFLRSATLLLLTWSRMLLLIGSRHNSSLAFLEAVRIFSTSSSELPKSPVVSFPKATTQAPVSVATSTTVVQPSF